MAKNSDNTEALKVILLETIGDVRSKKIEVSAANAVAYLAKGIIGASRIELDYVKIEHKHAPLRKIKAIGKKI